MLTRVRLEISGSQFEVEGSFELGDSGIQELLGVWFAAVPNTAVDQAKLDVLTATLQRQQDALTTSVDTATPAITSKET